MKFDDLNTFKRLVRENPRIRRGEQLSAGIMRKPSIAKAVDAGTRRLKFTMSTAAVDLDNDTIDQGGWDFSVFKTNPAAPWSHQADELPIAKWVSWGIEGGKLRGIAEFVPASMPVVGPLAEAVYQMNRTGFLAAVSVGFIPLEFDIANDRDDGDTWAPPVNFKKQRLI